MALLHSEGLQQADNRLRQAELDSEIATAAYLPKIDGSATGAYMLPDMDMMGMELRMRGTYMAGISLTQPIYAGGKIMAGKRLARIGKESAGEQLRMARMDVLVEADNAYWTYIAVERKVRMLEGYCARMDTLRRQVDAALAAGMATENDLLRIEAKYSEVRYQLQKVRNGSDLCRLSLCRVIGAELDTEIVPTDTVVVASEPVRLVADMAGRPELRLLEKQAAEHPHHLRPVALAIPINLRSWFPSETLRNFILTVRPCIDPSLGEYSLEEIIRYVHSYMNLHLSRQEMRAVLTGNVKFTRNRLLQIIPMFLKQPVMAFSYQQLGVRPYTATYTNPGPFRVPGAMEPYIERMEVILGQATRPSPHCASISYGDTLEVTFAGTGVSSETERLFFTHLVQAGIHVKVISNRNT